MMQQTQQILLSVKHKLPEPNSILPSELIKSQPARHIRKRVHDIEAISSYDWPLDKKTVHKKQQMAVILSNYYGPNYDISQLLKQQEKIVFLNSMVSPCQHENENYYFGSISTSVGAPRRSIANPFVQQSTYQLEFDDRIQSGNLYFALQHEPGVYLLANRLDYNTRSYGQWFYFKVTNVTKISRIFQFYIVNMTKNGTMFGKGLKVSVCRAGVWSKQGSDIQYVPNKFIRRKTQQAKNMVATDTYYTLTFSLDIKAFETIYIAYNQPYTYTKLGRMLDHITHDRTNVNRSVICRTPLGNRIEIITITKRDSLKNKKIIFITARAHPVQTAGSYVVEGIIQELLVPKNPQLVDMLLKNYIIKIVPMVNPDGVIIGNSRCNIYGFDLNRQWKQPSKNTSPEILSLKKAILRYQGRIQMFLDLHGHSTKKSVFAYGCHDIKNPIASRQFPYILSKHSKDDFNYSQCRFSLLTDTKNSKKQGTARISLWKRLRIPNIFTIQNSYCCAQDSQIHYDSKSYANIGKDIVISLCSYFANQQSRTQLEDLSKSENIYARQKESFLLDLRNNINLINLNVRNEDQVSSQSEPEDRLPPQQFDTVSRQKNTKLYFRQKTQKTLKNTVITSQNGNTETKQKKNNATIDARRNKKQEQQLIHSASNIDQKIRRRYMRNLSPINKQTIQLKKCEGVEIKQEQNPLLSSRGDSHPNLLKFKNTKTQQKNHAVSIIQIGLQSYTESNRDQIQLVKAYSAKNIKNDFGMYHGLNNKINQNNKVSGMIKNLNFVSPVDAQDFSDYYQYRQPVLKFKKNLNRNPSKIQEFMKKIATLQIKSNFRVNLSKNNK